METRFDFYSRIVLAFILGLTCGYTLTVLLFNNNKIMAPKAIEYLATMQQENSRLAEILRTCKTGKLNIESCQPIDAVDQNQNKQEAFLCLKK